MCINIKKLIDGNINLNKNEVFNFASNKPITINKFKKIIYSYNKKIQFVENNIPKFYKISLNKTNDCFCMRVSLKILLIIYITTLLV